MELIEITNCPLCDSDIRKELFRDKNRRDAFECNGVYVQCGECSLVYLSQRPSWGQMISLCPKQGQDVNADLPTAGFVSFEKMQKYKTFINNMRFKPHLWPLAKVPLKGKRLLDVGCGNGAKLIEFANRGYEVWGIDISAESIEYCKKLLPEGTFIQGELQNADLPAGSFDYIRMDNVLEHTPNPSEIVSKCYDLLKKQGRLLIFTPHGQSLSMRFMKGYSISSWIPFHLQLFTQKTLRLLLKSTNFENIKIYDYYPASWLPLSIVQWKNRNKKKIDFMYPAWLNYLCYPLGYLSARIGLAEELVGVGTKH